MREAKHSMAAARKIRATNGTNLGGANAHNRRVIIEALRWNGALSRADLARATQLTKQTVSNLVEDLDRAGLIRPLEAVRAARGKPATPYVLVADGAYSLGLQIDRHMLRIVAVDLLGDVLLQRETQPPGQQPERGVPAILGLIAAARRELSQALPQFEERLIGLGVAMPGPFGVEGEPDDPLSMSSWQRYPLLNELSTATGLEVMIQNDATAAATAERLMGAARGLKTAICIYLGYGLGAGLILDGALFTGPNGNAGEIGILLAPTPGAATGAAPLEHAVSLASLCTAMGYDPADPQLFNRIEARVANPDATFLAWTDRASDRLRWLVHVLETLFDPEAIIVCGGAPRSLITLLLTQIEPLEPSLAGRSNRRQPRVLAGKADQWAVATGAAAEPMARFSEPRYATMLKA